MSANFVTASNDAACYVPGCLRLDTGSAPMDDFIARAAGFHPRLRDWTFSQVFSPFWRLYHNFAPGHFVECEGRRVPLGPAHFVLVPESVLFHCVGARGRPGHLYVHFNLRPGCLPAFSAPLTVPAHPAGRQLARALAVTLRAASPDPRAGAHLVSALLHWTFAQVREDLVRPPSPGVRAALEHLESHLAADVSNGVLARVAGMSLRNFLRAFTAETGVAPHTHVRGRRLREAARLLAHTNESIDAVAEAVGFPNRHYLTRQFTAAFACPPARFRSQHRASGGRTE